jgi:hypothetical protein
LLKHANTQLLEFRRYDELFDRGPGQCLPLDRARNGDVCRRWGPAREAERLNTIRLDITDIAERTQTSIKS